MRIERSDPSSDPSATVIIVHGFTRSPNHLSSLSEACVALGARTLRPALGSLWWPTSTNNTRFLDAVALALLPVIEGPVVVAGHSAGAAAGAWIAAGLRGQGAQLRGLVMIDGVESPRGLVRRSWPRLAGVPIAAVLASPSRCNRDGALDRWLQQQDRDVDVTTIDGSGHGDIETSAAVVYRWACGDSVNRPAAPIVMATVVARISGMLRSGEPATPGP